MDAKAQFRSLAEPWADTGTSTGRLIFLFSAAWPAWSATLSAPALPRAAAGRGSVGRTGGRPPKFADDDIEAAKAILANLDIGATQIAAPPWRLSRDALSLHPRRPNREYPGRLRPALYPAEIE